MCALFSLENLQAGTVKRLKIVTVRLVPESEEQLAPGAVAFQNF